MDLALNNRQRLICHKNQPTNQPTKKKSEHWEKESYKHLGILEADTIKQVEIKENI